MKKSKLQKAMHTVVAALLSLITIFSTTVGAFAWTVDGSGIASGGGGKATNKGYSIPSEFATTGSMPIAGARFSVYNKYSGETLGTIDVFRNTPLGANYITAEKFSVKLNKIQLKKVYNKQSFSTTTSQAKCYQASAVANKLPMYAQGMKDWEAVPDNFKGILSKILGGNANIDALSPGDMILIEPLFPLRAHGTMFVLTPTEMAILGAQEFDGWDSTGPSTSQEGTWGYISHYTNVFYPQAMYLDTTSLPEELPVGWSLYSGNNWDGIGGTNRNNCHASFRTIIEKGFGVHIAYENTQPQWEPPTIETIHETYNFKVVEELYDANGKLVYTYPTKTTTLTNKAGVSINGTPIYVPVTHTFSVASEMRGNAITGRLQYNNRKYMFSSATLVEESGNNTGTRTTEISNRSSLYSISGDATLTITYWYLHDDDENQWYGYYNGVLGWYPASVAFSGYKVAYDGAPVVNVNKANATIQYKGANVTLSVSPDFQFYAVSDEETLTLSKLNGSVTVFAQWQQIPKKFTVEFVDKNGNPAFDAWNSAVRYEYNSTSGLEIATGASETHFADSLIDFGNDKFNGYILLAGTSDGTLKPLRNTIPHLSENFRTTLMKRMFRWRIMLPTTLI